MRKSIGVGVSLFLAFVIHAQTINITFSINTSLDTVRISPYIYGANQNYDNGVRITARRVGGNRMSGYNWENNASNAGNDYFHSSDDYMTWVSGIPSNKADIPGITLTAFHDTSIAHGLYSLVTLPAAGYVSRDKNGTVDQSQTAPSYRWREVRNFKGAPFALTPDTSDGLVYVDEEVNFLKNKYGPASGTTGVKGYSVDNEPALWPSTHPRIHPTASLCKELIAKVVGVGKAVKSVDPSAEVFGGVFYGFNEYYNFQNAPDWNSYSKYENYAAALLANLRDSSNAAGQRLLDVLDMHWYPDLNVKIINESTDSLTVYNRVQVPRTLWDSTHIENGWIGQYFHPQSAAIIRKTQRIIGQQYPGTKLAVTEFNYGGTTHISGAIAMADVLGIFGAYGVYFSSLWGDITGYVASAYKMYTNYNGSGGTFGDLSVRATTPDNQNSAVHAALESGAPGGLHIIAINRNFNRSIAGQFMITSGVQYKSATAYAVLQGSPQIQSMTGVGSIQGNQFTYRLPPMSVLHFVLSVTTAVADEARAPGAFALDQNYPNPFNPTTTIRFTLPSKGYSSVKGKNGEGSIVTLNVYDVLGREVRTLVNENLQPGNHETTFEAGGLASGVYFYTLRAGNFTDTKRLLLLR